MTAQVMIGKILGVLKTVNLKQLISVWSRIKFSVTIVPGATSYIRARNFHFGRVLLVFIVFGLFVALTTGLLMIYTPLNRLFFSETYKLSHYQVSELQKLDNQVNYLIKEIDRLKDNNERLQKAIILGDSSALKEFFDKNTTEKKIEKPPIGSNLLLSFKPLSSFMIMIWKYLNVELRRPCDGYISNRFRPADGHYGIDYSLNAGSPVFAVTNGYIVFSDFTVNDGNMIIINHTDGFVSVYKHCSQLIKRQRQKVIQGEIIGLSGNTGRLSHGTHLHFELWKDGVCVDPEKYLIDN